MRAVAGGALGAVIMAMQVMVQMIRVSMMVPSIEIRPCLAGESFCAAAAAIGALPIPASLEKIPLAIPFCIAMITAPKGLSVSTDL